MTCPIRIPTQVELDTLHVNWKTNSPCDPTSAPEPLDETMPVPLGYSNDLGEMDLLDHDTDLSDLGSSLQMMMSRLNKPCTGSNYRRHPKCITSTPRSRIKTSRNASLFWGGNLLRLFKRPMKQLLNGQQLHFPCH